MLYDNIHLCTLLFTHDIIAPFRKHHNVIIIYYSGIIHDHSIKWHSCVQSYKSFGVLYSNYTTYILSHPWKYITSKIAKINLSEVWTFKEHKSYCDILSLCESKAAVYNHISDNKITLTRFAETWTTYALPSIFPSIGSPYELVTYILNKIYLSW